MDSTILSKYANLFYPESNIRPMRGCHPINLPISEMGQLLAWSRTEPRNSIKRRNSRIILELAEGWLITQAAEELELCRQTVSEVRRNFLIFGLDGISNHTPRLGRKPSIIGIKADAVMRIASNEAPLNGHRWTTQQLARRCEMPPATLGRFLYRRGISLDDPRTLNGTTNGARARILSVAGLFLSPSISVMAFRCASRGAATTDSPSVVTRSPGRNIAAMFSRETERILGQIEEIQRGLLRMKSKRTDLKDILMFMHILDKRTNGHREVLLITNATDLIADFRLARWLEGHPRFHHITTPSREPWVGELRELLGSVREQDRRAIGLQLENINTRLREWREGPCRNLGVFASVNTMG